MSWKGDANCQHKQSLNCKNTYWCIIWEFWKKITIVYFSFISSLTICIFLFWIDSECIVLLNLRRNCTSRDVRLKIIIIIIFSVMETLASTEQGELIKGLPTYLSGSFPSPRCCFNVVSSAVLDIISISTAELSKSLPVETLASTRTFLASSNDIAWQFDVGSNGALDYDILRKPSNKDTMPSHIHIHNTNTVKRRRCAVNLKCSKKSVVNYRLDKYIYLCIDIEFQWHHFLSLHNFQHNHKK